MFTATFAMSLLFLGSLPAAEHQQSAGAQQPSVNLPAAIARVLTDYEAAWKSGDAAALAHLFAEDGFVLPNGRPPVRGRASIEKLYTGQGGPLALRALAFAADGGVGYIIGGFTRHAGEPTSESSL